MQFIKAKKLKDKPTGALGFGKHFTDYMYLREYRDGKWQEGKIMPYSPIELLPATSVLHYAQAVFEGLKAYRNKNGEVRLFRPLANCNRLKSSCERLCIPAIEPQEVLQAIEQLVEVEKEWIPTGKGESLYIRPFVFATDDSLGVHSAKSYKFIIILSPSGAYYANGFAPVKLLVEREYVRACKGGTGAYKVVGNYASSLYAAERAIQKGYDQVLWLDSNEREYVEEVGSMNIFFVIDGKVVTPELSGSILPGITRDSVIQILKDDGIPVEERKISISEVKERAQDGLLTEVFGTGTAAVISPVDVMNVDGVDYKISNGVGKISSALFERLTSIQTGNAPDTHNWVTLLNK